MFTQSVFGIDNRMYWVSVNRKSKLAQMNCSDFIMNDSSVRVITKENM